MIRGILGRITAITFLGTLLAGNAQAEFPPPPHGENLIADPSFEAALEATPWQAESGALSDMLQRMNYFVGLCEYRSGLSSLRFRARDTDDVLAVRQEVTLPTADYYDLSFYIARCSGDMTGNLGVSLGNASEFVPINMPQLSEYETESTRMTFRFDASEVFGAKTEGETPGLALVIANPALNGTDMYIDDVRLVPGTNGDSCEQDNDLVGTWLRRFCNNFEQDKWEFNADGRFQLTVDRYYDEGDTDYYFGTWCSDDTQTPPVVRLHVDRRAYFSDMNEWYEYTSPRDTEWFGRYERVEGALQLKVSECPVDDLVDAAVLGTGVPIASCAKFLTPCATTEGEDPTEGEGGGSEDTSLLGIWGRGVCDKDLDLPRHDWIFNDDGSFQEIVVVVGAGSVVRYTGAYTVDMETSPAQVDLHYTLRETYDDVVEEEGEPSDCNGGLYVYIDTCEILEFTDLGVFEIVDTTLKLATGDCRPDSTIGALEHDLNGTFCVSEEALGEYSRGPGECGGEGEGEACPSVPTTDANIVGTWHQKCVVPASKGGLLSGSSTEWTFNVDGKFRRVSTNYNDEVTTGEVTGTYVLDTSVTPHQVDLIFCEYCYDDIFDEEEGCDWCCSNPNSTWRGLYAVDGDFLQFRYGFNRPTLLGEEDTYKKDSPEFCPDDNEGEGEGDLCKGDKCEGELDFGAYEAIQLFGEFDSNQDNQLNLDEAAFLGVSAETFAQLDLNGDGQLSPAELLIGAGAESPRHSADTDLDGVLSLGELLRAIQFYNAGGYSCAPLAESEDGYLPEPFTAKGADPNCPAHAADYNPADGVISLSELLRAIQLYNTGAYTPCESGEDGFCGEG